VKENDRNAPPKQKSESSRPADDLARQIAYICRPTTEVARLICEAEKAAVAAESYLRELERARILGLPPGDTLP